MLTKLLLTIFTMQGCIGGFLKALGMKQMSHLPAHEQKKRHSKKTPSIKLKHEYIRRKHHCKIPIVYATCVAATVLHHPGLERTEKQNTYHITNAISKADKHEYSLVNYTKIIKKSNASIQSHPRQNNKKHTPSVCRSLVFLTSWIVVSRKLLLTAHTFKARRKESTRHFKNVRHPNYQKNTEFSFKPKKYIICLTNTAYNVKHDCRKKQSGATSKLYIMQGAYRGELFYFHII